MQFTVDDSGEGKVTCSTGPGIAVVSQALVGGSETGFAYNFGPYEM